MRKEAILKSTSPPYLLSLLRWFLRLEPLWLAAMLVTFFYRSPARDPWLVLCWGLPLFMAARWLVFRRLRAWSPLDPLYIAFLLLAALNVWAANIDPAQPPFTRGLMMLGRPVMGIALSLAFVDSVRRSGRIDAVLHATLALTLLVSFLGLTAVQWNAKSLQLAFITERLPRFTAFPDAAEGFNANEAGGVLAWTVPLSAGLALATKRRLWRWGFGAAFAGGFLALILGQSRFAIAGTLVALALLVPLVILCWRNRAVAWGMLAVIAILEILLIQGAFAPEQRSGRQDWDSESAAGRLALWDNAWTINCNHPVFGVGLNMFRYGRVRALYPVEIPGLPIIPHTHNEFLQIGTDLGVPGWLWAVALASAVIAMLWRIYRRGDTPTRRIAAAVGVGLLAHAVFGMGDAIPIWDRWAFVSFWLLGLGCSVFEWVRPNNPQRNLYPFQW
jgi:O-antigen ligase